MKRKARRRGDPDGERLVCYAGTSIVAVPETASVISLNAILEGWHVHDLWVVFLGAPHRRGAFYAWDGGTRLHYLGDTYAKAKSQLEIDHGFPPA